MLRLVDSEIGTWIKKRKCFRTLFGPQGQRWGGGGERGREKGRKESGTFKRDLASVHTSTFGKRNETRTEWRGKQCKIKRKPVNGQSRPNEYAPGEKVTKDANVIGPAITAKKKIRTCFLKVWNFSFRILNHVLTLDFEPVAWRKKKTRGITRPSWCGITNYDRIRLVRALNCNPTNGAANGSRNVPHGSFTMIKMF